MRILKFGEQEIRVRATPLALLYYKQEFKTDLVADFITLEKFRKDMSHFDSVLMLQLVWAMAKADAFGKTFPPFIEWLGSLEAVDFTDEEFLMGALEEAADGFFRKGAKPPQE
ncbi:hypothetical protein SAMN02799630_01222 [Paenibacillus sp. UNCCL117]|uniref:hypothetical protein n=1 Tax=unclassified Paenibacillus TaxID=185978 RepID=UPI00088B26F0|nr:MULTISPECIES: hypothetical protein [unclassified Paenibacillus]SDC70017.1 hypothetical protein SAMN04488602_103200 [Paenibacillus sp. cl123]SFW24090.1 hypothetical protein SAMN02799630_01222 [Paenibacillus sp. UNCCL117]